MTALPAQSAAAAYVAFLVVLLGWDIRRAATAVQLQRGSHVLRWLTGLCGLLVVPAVAISWTASSAVTGRTTSVVAWVWPVTALLFVLHAAVAIATRQTRPALGVPLLLFNLTVAVSAAVQYLNASGVPLPDPLGALALAHATALGVVFGRVALVSPWAVSVPVLAPLVPAQTRWGRVGSLVVGTFAMAFTVLVVGYVPHAIDAWDSFANAASDRLQERPHNDFAIGLRLLPEVERAPSPSALRYDLGLIDSLDLDVIEVYTTPEATRGTALDSVARALDDLRRDSVTVILSMGYDPWDRRAAQASPAAYARSRVEAVDRAVRRLRPDVLIPLREPGSLGTHALGPLPLSWWIDALQDAAERARRVRPRTRVGASVSVFTPLDSAVFAWASGPQSPLDVAGVALSPSFGGGRSLEAQLRVAGQWSRSSSRPLWVFSVSANPRVFGETNQGRTVWSVMAWATSMPEMEGVVIDGAADYDALVGLRAPNGRLRSAVATIGRVQQSLAEATAVRP